MNEQLAMQMALYFAAQVFAARNLFQSFYHFIQFLCRKSLCGAKAILLSSSVIAQS